MSYALCLVLLELLALMGGWLSRFNHEALLDDWADSLSVEFMDVAIGDILTPIQRSGREFSFAGIDGDQLMTKTWLDRDGAFGGKASRRSRAKSQT